MNTAIDEERLAVTTVGALQQSERRHRELNVKAPQVASEHIKHDHEHELQCADRGHTKEGRSN